MRFFEEYGSSDTSTGTEMTWTADGHGGESFMKQPYILENNHLQIEKNGV